MQLIPEWEDAIEGQYIGRTGFQNPFDDDYDVSDRLRAVGQPTRYRKKLHCELALRYLGQGATAAQLCAIIKIETNMFYTWQREHPEFMRAVNLGQVAGESVWTEIGKSLMYDRGRSFPAWKFFMQNLYGWDDAKDEPLSQELSVQKVLPRAKANDQLEQIRKLTMTP